MVFSKFKILLVMLCLIACVSAANLLLQPSDYDFQIVVHVGKQTKIVTPEMDEFYEIMKILRSTSNITRTPKTVMAVPYELKNALDNEMYVEFINGDNATLIVLSGEFENTIFTGKKGYMGWTGNTGRFIEKESGNIVYMNVYSADRKDALRLKKIILQMFQPTIKMEVKFPEVPGKLMVYKVKEPEVTKGNFIKMAEKFGLKGNVMETKDKFILKNGSVELEIIKTSGRITYGDISEMYGNLSEIPNLPSEKVAFNIAINWLKNFGLMPNDAKFSKVVRDWAEIAKKDGVRKVDTIVQVIFKREIDGFPVEGVGSKLKVYIGDGGKVVGVYKCWREIEPYKEVKLRSPEKALQMLKQMGVHGVLTPVGLNLTVKRVYIAYFAQPPTTKQEYFLPVYVFEIDIGNGEVIKQYVYAVDGEKFGVSDFPLLDTDGTVVEYSQQRII